MRQKDYDVIEPMACEDIFITGIGRVEQMDSVMRFWLCAAETDQRGKRYCVVRAKLIIPMTKVVPIAREVIAYSCPSSIGMNLI